MNSNNKKSNKKENFSFQTEVKQLLNLMIHSLYSNKEIFLRELISNGSDAIDKLRFQSITNIKLTKEYTDPVIIVDYDKNLGILSIKDNGIGMSRNEVIDNLGTIAKSGTKDFFNSLTGDNVKDSQLIGQFGVGFYSAFMVADKVIVNTRHINVLPEEGVHWESQGQGDYTVELKKKLHHGTEIILYLKKEHLNLLETFTLKNIITKYSDHISVPIKLREEKEIQEKDNKDNLKEKKKDKKTEIVYETVNLGKAIWLRSKKNITNTEYKDFYRHVSHDFGDPLSWIHNSIEGKQEFVILLYIPKNAPFDLWDRDKKSGIKLYIKKVFIMDNADIMPIYLRFIKGVIDSSDLPLNISREILQKNPLVDKIKSFSVKKILSSLERMSKNQPEDYKEFWKTFGQVMKEGPAEDFDNKELIIKLLRFSSTFDDKEEQSISLEEYVKRMKETQKFIYYITADSFLSAKNSPHLEIFRKKNIEVLLLSDRVDEWLVSNVNEFSGKKFKSITIGELDINQETENKSSVEKKKKHDKNFESIINQMKKVLGAKVKDIRLTDRLTDSPSCVVSDNTGMSMHLQRLMSASGKHIPSSVPIFELNPKHHFLQKLQEEQDDQCFSDWTHILFNQALLSEAGSLADPSEFIKLINKYLK